MTDPRDVVEQFVDGEPVDPQLLAEALSQGDVREHLIAVLVLRALVGGRGPTRLAVSSPAPRIGRRLRVLTAVAALAAVCLAGGYLAGQRARDGSALTPVDAGSRPAALEAPAPTRVIRLENGVDWNERGGGN